MWKILLGFAVFAAAALYILNKAGGDVDMGGEKHSVEAPHATDAAKPAAATGTALSPAASAAEAAAMAASAASQAK